MRAALDAAGVAPGDEVELCGVDTDACVLTVALDRSKQRLSAWVATSAPSRSNPRLLFLQGCA
jgi:hypothetical protein